MTGPRVLSVAALLAAVAAAALLSSATVSATFHFQRERRTTEDLQCGNEITTTACDCTVCLAHNSTWLEDKCCVYQGIPASLLAFEREDLWIPRLKEFNACTGARVQLTYNGEDGEGDEDTMEEDLRQDVGVSYRARGGGLFQEAGAGIYDAYIVQPPWLPAIVDGLENLSPWISENTAKIGWTDVNPATREAVSFNGTVRALPLDTDYVALGYRQDVYDRNGLQPPETLEELVAHSELLNGKDHNGDGEPDWGYCLTPQVNYLYAFVAPVLQTTTQECEGFDDCKGRYTEQNLFFNATTFEPYLDHPGLKYAIRLFSRLVRSSNCQTELATTGKCDRKTAFPTGRCAGVLSMPGTLTQLLLPDGKYSINVQRDGEKWQPDTTNGYWGRRLRFPGSEWVYNEEKGQLDICTAKLCPKGLESSTTPGKIINYAPFFAEGGESYSIRSGTAASKKEVMQDFFGWLSTLPVTRLPLSGQYRRSHLREEQKQVLLDDDWPREMADDLFDVLRFYFLEDGNPAQDLLMLGFSEYQGAFDQHVFSEFLLSDDFFYLPDYEWEELFDDYYDTFVAATTASYRAITDNYGRIQQLERWRASLSLPPLPLEQICQESALQQEEDCVLLAAANKANESNQWAVIVAIVMVVAFVLVVGGIVLFRRYRQESLRRRIFEQEIKRAQQQVHDEMVQRFGYDKALSSRYESLKVQMHQVTLGRELGRGAFGVVMLGDLERNGSVMQVAVKRLNQDVDSEEQNTFLYECRLLAMLDHPHITRIVAVQVDAKPVLLMTEYMEMGSLVQVLRNTRASAVTEDRLFNILAKIADACVYLASHNIVHRDIAARNVLVGSQLDDVRLSDFGMSRLMANTDYYRKKSDDMVPIKWMPLEAIEKKLFSSASDVWAWGVLAWEVMTLGTTPWASHSAVETALAIAKGERLPKPALSSEDLYKLMLRSWEHDPDDRPTFRRILRFFRGKCSAVPNAGTTTSIADSTGGAMDFSTFAQELEERKADAKQLLEQRPSYTSVADLKVQAAQVAGRASSLTSGSSVGTSAGEVVQAPTNVASNNRHLTNAPPSSTGLTSPIFTSIPENSAGIQEVRSGTASRASTATGYHSLDAAQLRQAREAELMKQQLQMQQDMQDINMQQQQQQQHRSSGGASDGDAGDDESSGQGSNGMSTTASTTALVGARVSQSVV
ncbi:TK protein kinase [Salpingoeca rosetta]|uniref:TK protein kinase n=1 Tax=Salpingoeca rosetta (strain ATCC 50818 / BSB-021) TaxID=946362 RepID=F2UIT2_SALR5|nr:TK protein kinase [Salpingoeca rosetta]EGD77131.1 TK protein kinase [Salpingoeca rosetta]|eukprot:XP_004990970.1 TK protein kinase [Salpingoeca rosetta]